MRGIEFKNEVWDLIRLIRMGMDVVFRPMVESFGLTMLQLRIMIEIEENELSTVGSLASKVGLTSGNASTICKKLEKTGFIKRIRSSKDERFVKLVLTELGKETIKKIDLALQEKYASILEAKTEQDFNIIMRGIKKLNEILSEMGEIE
mgnify:FL=1